MIEIILGIIIGLCIVYRNNKDFFREIWHGEYFIDKVGIFVLLCAGVLFGGLGGMLLAVGVGNFVPSSWVETNTENLAALRDNISTTGSFFLGSGSINGEMEYYYYVDLGDNSYQSESLPAKSVTIVEDNPKQPYLATYDHFLKNHWFNLFALDPIYGEKLYEFHIPTGSVVKGYNLNLGK